MAAAYCLKSEHDSDLTPARRRVCNTALSSSACDSVQMQKADGSIARGLAPAGPVPQGEQSTLVREVAHVTQTGTAAPQEALAKLSGPTAGAHTGSDAEKEITCHAHSHAEAGFAVINSPVNIDAAAAVPAAAGNGAAKPAAEAETVTKWVPSPHVTWLEWPEDEVERRLSNGATAVVFR